MPRLPGIVYITRRRAAQIFDRDARRSLAISGEEFARRYRAGETADLDHSAVTELSLMLPWFEG